ncbi:hypothetical protein DRE_00491 [Drechslerella stenobrocha 248]|uniref:Uncharacterized protein n=1 Tax=Drechslerella stenobrocha 248 TaxID=1043628 RepID=W7I5S2_9PEZI|nr:hypothetical protein DRE_00491 [Drechslerella stenobrocha 248]
MAAVAAIPSFTLKAVAPGAPFDGMPLTLDGPFVGLNSTGTVARFYATGIEDSFSWSLHGYPTGIVDEPALLVGDNTYRFAFLPQPEETSKSYGPRMMMDGWSFNIGRPSAKIAPATGKFLSYNFEHRWYAFPAQEQGQWTVMWWDGSCCVTAVGIPLKLQLSEVDPRSY